MGSLRLLNLVDERVQYSAYSTIIKYVPCSHLGKPVRYGSFLYRYVALQRCGDSISIYKKIRESETMAIDESTLNKGQIVKLNALRKSVGDDLADAVFTKWLKRQVSTNIVEKADPIAEKLTDALSKLVKDKTFRLGNKGYTVRRARGKGASGFVAEKNEK